MLIREADPVVVQDVSPSRESVDFRGRDLLGMEDLTATDICAILDSAASFKEISEREIKKVPTLRGKTIINAFFEASTRTRLSFEIAGKRLSADTVNISGSTSSVVKGETLEDTAKNIEAMAPDIIVIRHGHSGAPHYGTGLPGKSAHTTPVATRRHYNRCPMPDGKAARVFPPLPYRFPGSAECRKLTARSCRSSDSAYYYKPLPTITT